MKQRISSRSKKIFPIVVFLLFLQSCNFPLAKNNSFSQKVSTEVASALTQTAQANQWLAATMLPTPSIALPTFTPTALLDNPKSSLGNATWQDSLTNGNSFGLGNEEEQISGTNASVWVKDGAFHMYRPTASGGYMWYCAYPKIADFYLEAQFEVQSCNGEDEYGLFVRKPDFTDKSGYYFLVTCDGKFNLMRWTDKGTTLLGEWQTSEFLNKGPEAANVLGVWAKSTHFRLYINDHFVAEYEDNAGLTSGYFGVFSNAKQSAGLLVKMDEIAYWNLP